MAPALTDFHPHRQLRWIFIRFASTDRISSASPALTDFHLLHWVRRRINNFTGTRLHHNFKRGMLAAGADSRDARTRAMMAR